MRALLTWWRNWRADRAADELQLVFLCLFIFLYEAHRPTRYDLPALRLAEIEEMRLYHEIMVRKWAWWRWWI